MILEQLYLTSFEGASGKIEFDRESGFSARRVDIFQVGTMSGSYISSSKADIIHGETISLIPDVFASNTLRENRGLSIFFTIVVCIQLIIIVHFHILTTVYHKMPSIKAASPKLLHISYVGVYVVGAGALLHTHSAALINVELRHYICQFVWSWALPIVSLVRGDADL